MNEDDTARRLRRATFGELVVLIGKADFMNRVNSTEGVKCLLEAEGWTIEEFNREFLRQY